MLSYNEIKPKKIIEVDGEPYQVLSAAVSRKQKQKPVNKTKLKHLISGNVTDRTFQQSETVEEADVDIKEVKYLYNKPTRDGQAREWWFSDPSDPSNRFTVDAKTIGENAHFLKENETVKAQMFNDEVVGITLPIKMQFIVVEAPPNIKGSTASGGNKLVTLETGATINTPMFIETGDTIVVNTESGVYVERVKD